MALNLEAARLVVGAALLSADYRELLLHDRRRAISRAERQPAAPTDVHLSEDDRMALRAIRASTLEEFARGVERLSRVRLGEAWGTGRPARDVEAIAG